MKKNELTIIFIRLLGIYFVIVSIAALSNLGMLFTFNAANNDPDTSFQLSNAISLTVPSMVYFLSGIVLLVLSKSIGRKIYSGLEEQIPEVENYRELQSILFSVAGVIIVIYSLHQLISSCLTLIYIRDTPYPEKFIRDTWFSVIEGVVQMLIGLILIVQTRTITKLLTKIREWDPKT